MSIDTWGWLAQGASGESGTSPGDDIRTNYNGFNFAIGGNTTIHSYGEMAMVDGDNNGTISAVQANGSLAPGNGDRFTTPDGVDRQIYEIRIFDNSVYTYTDTSGAIQTYTARAVVYQLGNGSLVVRMRDDDSSNAPSDFFIKKVTNIQLGVWDGTNYGTTIVSNFDAVPPNVCFSSGTLILTDHGEVLIENLRIGDLVATQDEGLQPIRWIGSRKLDVVDLTQHPKLRPIRIQAGALGDGRPSQDLVVSPQHRVLVRSVIAERMFGEREVLVAANKLLMVEGIDVDIDATEVEYFHMLFNQHQILFSNGAATESLFTGPEAIKAVAPEVRHEIQALFPKIMEPDFVSTPVRYIPEKGRLMKKLAQRHQSNGRPLFEA